MVKWWTTTLTLLNLLTLLTGLFHKVILESGSAINPWAVGYSTPSQLAEAAGITFQSEKQVFDHLKNLPVKELLEAQEKRPDVSCNIDTRRWISSRTRQKF